MDFILKKKYKDSPTYDQAAALYRPVLPFTPFALCRVAQTVRDKPEQYEKLLLQAADISPAWYYNLCSYATNLKQDDKAAEYLEKACAADPDAVRVSNHAVRRVRYFLKKGQTDKARQIADDAGEVYSYYGLEAKAFFLEATTNYDGAFEWFGRIEERYNKSLPLLDFCLRYKAQTGDLRFDSQVEKRIKKLFPKGIEKVSLSDFHGPPTDGVLIRQENDLLKSAGLRVSNVIVAVYGISVHDLRQYTYGRDTKTTPELDLIVWQGDAYREFKPSPPRHRFGLDFGDYSTPKPGKK